MIDLVVFFLTGLLLVLLGFLIGSLSRPRPPAVYIFPSDICPHCGGEQIGLCVAGCRGGLPGEVRDLNNWKRDRDPPPEPA